jgi:hypothetical protein
MFTLFFQLNSFPIPLLPSHFRLYELTTEADESTARKQQWESEKDDLLSQIAVLTEERDTAHGNEESLFEQLAERTQVRTHNLSTHDHFVPCPCTLHLAVQCY